MKCLFSLAPPVQLEEYIVFKCELKISSCLYANITAAARGRTHNGVSSCLLCIGIEFK
jgi:hypothetical protein